MSIHVTVVQPVLLSLSTLYDFVAFSRSMQKENDERNKVDDDQTNIQDAQVLYCSISFAQRKYKNIIYSHHLIFKILATLLQIFKMFCFRFFHTFSGFNFLSLVRCKICILKTMQLQFLYLIRVSHLMAMTTLFCFRGLPGILDTDQFY